MNQTTMSDAKQKVMDAMAASSVSINERFPMTLVSEVAQNWIDAKERPPEIGYIVKRWKNGSGFSFWAGYYSGDPKMASCDAWLKLPA